MQHTLLEKWIVMWHCTGFVLLLLKVWWARVRFHCQRWRGRLDINGIRLLINTKNYLDYYIETLYRLGPNNDLNKRRRENLAAVARLIDVHPAYTLTFNDPIFISVVQYRPMWQSNELQHISLLHRILRRQ